MAGETTTPRRVLPDGTPAPDAAPDSTLLDHDDLAQVYQALRSGHAVGLGADGHVYVHQEAGTAIDAPSQAFVEGKLAEVKNMLHMGFAVEIHPDGTINANNPDGRIQYRSDPNPGLGDEERATIRAAIVAGGNVGIRPDGTVEIVTPLNAQRRPYADDVDRVMRELDHQVSSGNLANAAKSGAGLVISVKENGDTAFDYKDQPKSTEPAIAFPAEIRDPHDPTAVDALHTQAAELAQRAAAVRETSNQNFEKQAADTGQQRDAAAREQTAAEQQVATARQQQADELKQADAAKAAAEAATTQAQQLDAAGKPDEAAEQRELARAKTAEATELGRRAAGAGDAATKVDQQATDAAAKVQQLDTQLADIKQHADVSETAADALENRAKAMTEAAGHLSEANRLDGEAVKARTDGDEEAARLIQNAADYERRLGSEASAKVATIALDEDLVDETLKPGSVTPMPVAPTPPTETGAGAGADTGAGTGPVHLPPPIFGSDLTSTGASAATPATDGAATTVAATDGATDGATDSLGDPVLTGAATGDSGATTAAAAAGDGQDPVASDAEAPAAGEPPAGTSGDLLGGDVLGGDPVPAPDGGGDVTVAATADATVPDTTVPDATFDTPAPDGTGAAPADAEVFVADGSLDATDTGDGMSDPAGDAVAVVDDPDAGGEFA